MTDDLDTDVAVVGLAGRFPGAAGIADFWQLLRDGVDATRSVTDDELRLAGVPEVDLADPRYVRVWAGLTDVDAFDDGLFGYSPQEAALIDPQQRIFLECAWAALEDAGIHPDQAGGEVGVFASSGINQYLLFHLLPNDALLRDVGRFAAAVSNDKDNLSTRVSYKLGLTGPSVTVQANCSSGLVALHQASSALLSYECDAALVGAVSVKSFTPRGYLHEPGGTSSPTGRCRSFDADADGYFIGDAVAAVVLRRLADVGPRDRVYAVVKASAVNNDGAAKVSFAAPSKSGQQKVISAALRTGAIAPGSVQYIEANGSATPMGDALEVAALHETYGRNARPGDRWLIGAVKPNVGNLDTVSGLTSFVKTVLAVHHGELPPTLNYRRPNPQTDLGAGPFAVNDTLREWPEHAGPRRAAVSSFGVGGTNVHVVLEEAPARPAPPPGGTEWQLLTVSARTDSALDSATAALRDHLLAHPELPLADVAYTCHVGRFPLRARRFVLARTTAEAVAALDAAIGSARPPASPYADRWAARLPDGGTFATQYALLAALAGWGLTPHVLLAEGTGHVAGAVAAGLLDTPGSEPLARPPRLVSAATGTWVAAYDPAMRAGTDALTDAEALVAEHAPAGIAVLGAVPTWGDEAAGDDPAAGLLRVVGRLWESGLRVDWTAFHRGRDVARVGLPAYPFERRSHWIAAPERVPGTESRPVVVATGGPPARTPPSTPVEEAVASVWRHRLGVADLDVHTSFLELGGDSLTAAQILGELADAFHLDLELRTFLEGPTVAALAAAISAELAEARAVRGLLDELDSEVR